MKKIIEQGVWYKCPFPDYYQDPERISNTKETFGAKIQLEGEVSLEFFVLRVFGSFQINCVLKSGNWRLCHLACDIESAKNSVKDALCYLHESLLPLAKETILEDLLLNQRRRDFRRAKFQGIHVLVFNLTERTDWNGLFLDYLLQMSEHLVILSQNWERLKFRDI